MSFAEIVGLILALPVALVLVGFSRALSVRAATGKWPHEDPEAMNIYKGMP